MTTACTASDVTNNTQSVGDIMTSLIINAMTSFLLHKVAQTELQKIWCTYYIFRSLRSLDWDNQWNIRIMYASG